jgi:copper(I)-binding protein
MFQRVVFAAMTTCAVALCACGEAVPRLHVERTWARPTIASTADSGVPSGPGVVYATVVNRGRASDRLTAARSPVCETVEIHRTTLIDDRMRMAPVEGGIEIPAGGRAEMKPGGLHIMLFGLNRHLREGERFEIAFEFERSGWVSATAEVRAP